VDVSDLSAIIDSDVGLGLGSSMESIVVIVVLVIILNVAGRYASFARIYSQKYQLPYIFRIEGKDLPECYKPFFKSAAKPLLEKGYKLVAITKQQPVETVAEVYQYSILLYNQSLNSFCWLYSSITPLESYPVGIRFQKYFKNGDILSTDNEHVPFRFFDSQHLHISSVSGNAVDTIWTSHIDNFEHYKRQHPDVEELLVSPRLVLERHKEIWDTDFENASEQGVVRGTKDGYFLGFKLAFQLSKYYQKRNTVVSKDNSLRNSSPDADEDQFSKIVPSELVLAPQVDMAKAALMCLDQKSARPFVSWFTFAISGVLFGVFFGLWLGWSVVPIIVGVLLFHELGHYFAMRLCSYRNTSIFFVPGLGAAAKGDAGSASFWQRLMVFYAGPLPGLVLAVGMFWAIPQLDGFIYSVVLTLLILNWFNLLPFMPLDGGQVLHLCLQEKSQVVFAWVSAAGLLVLAWLLSEPILWVVGGFSLLTAFNRSSLLQLRMNIKDLCRTSTNRDDFIRGALRLMQAPAYRNMDFSQRVLLVKEFLEDFEMPPIKGYERAVGFITYPVIFLFPVVLFFALTISSGFDRHSVEPAKDWESELASAASIDHSISLRFDAVRYHLDLFDQEMASYYVLSLREPKFEEVMSPNQIARMKGFEVRMQGFALFNDIDYSTLAGLLKEYIQLEPERDNEYYEVLNFGFYSLLERHELNINEVFSALADYLTDNEMSSDLAMVYSQMSNRDIDNSLSWLERAVDVAPSGEKEMYLGEIAYHHMTMKGYSDAFLVYETIAGLDIKNNYISNRYHSGSAWAAFKLGNHGLALEFYEKQIEVYEDIRRSDPLLFRMFGWGAGASVSSLIVETQLSQLVVADDSHMDKKIDEFSSEILRYIESHPEWAEQFRCRSMAFIESGDSWHSDVLREQVKVLDRYFLD